MAALQAGPPCWESGLSCPTLQAGVDPTEAAQAAVATVTEAVCARDGLPSTDTVGLVDSVFTLVQLALDDRCKERTKQTDVSPGESAFRSALLPGALGLVTRLTTALQPCERKTGDKKRTGETTLEEDKEEAGGEGGMRDAVVAAARHLSAMEELVASQNNTSALLIAHNGLAKLLKGRWPWLVGGVLDAPRLLAQLCSIYGDGLSQLKVALAQADAKRAGGSLPDGSGSGTVAAAAAGEVAHLKKFGKLLATFGARMSCLLRHLGPECAPEDRRQAYILFAQAAAVVYPGFESLTSREAKNAGSRGSPATPSLARVVADVVYPRAVEALLSAAGPPPCCPGECRCGVEKKTEGGLGSEESPPAPGVAVSAESADVENGVGRAGEGGSEGISGCDCCRCYHSSDSEMAEEEDGSLGGSRRRQRRQHHDPSEALEALHPGQPPQPAPHANSGGLGGSEGASGVGVPSERFSLGAILLLCEAVRCEETRLSKSVSLRLGEYCRWMLDHLSITFPSWVETAAARNRAGVGGDGSSWSERERVVRALCQEAAAALGCYVSRRAVQGDFEEAQLQMLEGCSCYPHPLCREIWCGALKVFIGRCDAVAQESVVQTFTEAALDPRVSCQGRRRLAHALHALTLPQSSGGLSTSSGNTDVTAGNDTSTAVATVGLLCPSAEALLRRFCLAPLLAVHVSPRSPHGTLTTIGSTNSGGLGEGEERGACALDLLRELRCLLAATDTIAASAAGLSTTVKAGEERGADAALADASTTFAKNVLMACLRDDARTGHSSGGAREDSRGNGCYNTAGDHVPGLGGAGQKAMTAATTFLTASAAAPAAALPSEGGKIMKDAPATRRIWPRELPDVAAAKEIGRSFGAVLMSKRVLEFTRLSERALAASVGLLVKTDTGSLPQLCAWIVESAGEGQVTGAGLLALAKGLSCLGRQSSPVKAVGASALETVLTDGFVGLFNAGLWPVTTSAMQALEAMARHADPRTAKLLPKLVPQDRLGAFKARLARRMVTLEGSRPVELTKIREHGILERHILTAAAARASSQLAALPVGEHDQGGRVLKRNQNGSVGGRQRQVVVLREGSDVSAMAGLLSSTIARIEVLSEDAGGGIRITMDT